jgi:hypothetical protein
MSMLKRAEPCGVTATRITILMPPMRGWRPRLNIMTNGNRLIVSWGDSLTVITAGVKGVMIGTIITTTITTTTRVERHVVDG